MLRLALDRPRAGNDGHRVDEVRRRIGRPAILATVAVLVRGSASRAGSLDVPVGQEHAGLLVESLPHAASRDMACLDERFVHADREPAVLLGMRRVVVVEADVEGRVIAPALGSDALDQVLRRDALGGGLQHDRRAMRVIGADVVAFVTGKPHRPHPDVRLDHLGHSAEMRRPVRVGQGARDEDAPHVSPVRAAARTWTC